jgi:hypothetical protein
MADVPDTYGRPYHGLYNIKRMWGVCDVAPESLEDHLFRAKTRAFELTQLASYEDPPLMKTTSPLNAAIEGNIR